MMKCKNYSFTVFACFASYIVQAIVNNFLPLLFIRFNSEYSLPISQITLLVTINFSLQLLTDLLSVMFIDRIGYRFSMLFAHGFCAAGFILLSFLPAVLDNHFVGILISVFFYAIGGGLLEVLVSPIMEGCPSGSKEKAMSLLHSFYCWGHVGVVLFSTLFFFVFGIANWRQLAILWAFFPMLIGIMFIFIPVPSPIKEGETGLSLKKLFSIKEFRILMLMMMCAGAGEQSVSQWASAFAEKALGITKALGDVPGPMMFAAMMGTSRAFFGRKSRSFSLDGFMAFSGLLCAASYLCIVSVQNPFVSLAGCAVTGFSVGIMWPGTFSKGSAAIKNGGTAMFALFALAGDLGCSGGPTLVGFVSNVFNDNIRIGILFALIFPFLMLFELLFLGRRSKSPQKRLC